MGFIAEIYQWMFISSIIFILYVLSDLGIKMYGRFAMKAETKFKLSIAEKIIFWIAVTIFFSYLF
jgi:hypothetical protein